MIAGFFVVLGIGAGIITYGLSGCRHKRTTKPYNNRQKCLDCGCERMYLIGRKTQGPWRKARVIREVA